MPEAIKFWAQTLKVYPVKRLFVDPRFCDDASGIDFQWGHTDADLKIFVSAQRYCGLINSDDSHGTAKVQIAHSDACDWDQYDRPIAGSIDFCYDFIPLREDGTASEGVTKFMIETAIHQIGHILGWKSNDLPYFYDSETGKPRTPRPVDLVMAKCIDITNRGANGVGAEEERYMPSNSTMIR
eukprot:4765149-Ditylum_brightwellii.AAC.1